ncbi:MAG: glycoside hydrolase [Clostridia bacterium]|nr:glycoside hydrolase [Clostridia bacterium]
MEKTIPMLEGEFWYGLCAAHGTRMPLGPQSVYSHRATDPAADTGNQESPLLLSSKGRYLWSDFPYDTEISGGVIRITNAADDLVLASGFETLRGAYLAACRAHFPPSGKLPPENFFRKPQYNTWAELIYDQDQASILGYARSILENGLPAGILMIDDGWMCSYGSRLFRPDRFPDPAAMLSELHAMGFEVMLWVCPFISPDSPEFRALSAKDCLVKNRDGSAAIRNWWNGYSAILDLSHPAAAAWLDETLGALLAMGCDGFKFDAGDVRYYRDDDRTYGNVPAHEQCRLWAKLGLKYPYNEYRASWNCASLPLVERLCDKAHRWESVPRLLTDALVDGLLGYPFCCPDMIGGGSFTDFLPGAPSLKPELFARYAEAAALMPMMQYSAAPWRVLDRFHAEICRDMGRLHTVFADRILALARRAAETGEPIMRMLAYEFPGEGFEETFDCFLLGSDLLVAPVLHEGERERTVRLPKGGGCRWRFPDGTVYEGGKTVTVPAPVEALPRFERV